MTGESARVVAWQWQEAFTGGWTDCSKDQALMRKVNGYATRELVTLTDHESALADWKLLVDEYKADGVAVQAKWHAAEQRLTTLLSGLEALAGRMEAAPERPSGAHWAQQLRTLASAGLEGKADGND